jgi:2-C-methyl-D-erythritol 2,4-cyclodiphosphate synthase
MTVTRVGLGFDVHPFGGDGPLVLGGVTIESPGLRGHSDADAVAHAIADALLGAAALGDLGTLFPATDDDLRGASSIELLRTVTTKVEDRGFRVVNVDVAIAAEQPPLAPHVAAMVQNLKSAMRGPEVSVKPKRAEGLGAIGRAEGVAVWAVALIQRG